MKYKLLLGLASLPAVFGIALWWVPGGGLVRLLLGSYAVVFLTLAACALMAVALRRLLWRVGHRLAFSYIMIGFVPIPLVGLMTLVGAYIASGFFLSHLYRDAAQTVAKELRVVAENQISHLRAGIRRAPPIPVTYYRDGRRLGGDPRAPEFWQDWWVKETTETDLMSPIRHFFVALEDGRPTLMAARSWGRYGILVLFQGDLERELSERSGVWVELLRSDETRRGSVQPLTFVFQERSYSLQLPQLDWQSPKLREFFHPDNDNPGLVERPFLGWMEISRDFLSLGTGAPAADYAYATLTGSPRTISYHLISRSAEVDTLAYLVLVFLGLVLFNLWAVAIIMAIFMIGGLSRAVNVMSLATRRVQHGDFSTRIEVFRRDQIGELQRSFNQMTENLETLVASAAQKEILEKELEIARELQRSLLPGEIATDDSLCFATHFAPCAAIGGDYYDVLPAADGRLAVVVADVSGHGVAAGLRMAMVKSALQLLTEEEGDPTKILERLHQLQKTPPSTHRAGQGAPRSSRGFVTATLALIDHDSGEVEITNAGHSPTYLWRRGKVTEIVLPSSPLGGLDGPFGHKTLTLEAGDGLVWLSDGLIEATNGFEEPFGYQGVVRGLESFGPASAVLDSDHVDHAGDQASALRDHLLELLNRHTAGAPPDDDRTLVVMFYRPRPDGSIHRG